METNTASIQKSALTAGLGLLIMTILSILIFPSLQAIPLHITGIAIIIILDVVVALSLYKFLKLVNPNLSLSTALFRIVYAIIFIIALIKMPDIDAFNHVWERGLLVFGFHLLLLGLLTIQAKYVPTWLGYLLLIASAGYIIDSLGAFWGYTTQIGIYTFIGELIFMFWLLFKGRKISI